MKHNNFFLLLVTTCFMVSFFSLVCADNICEIDEPEESEIQSNEQSSEILVDFKYENEDIVNIINFLAAAKKTNIILPTTLTSAKSTETIKVTLHIPNKISVDEAWDLLIALLGSASYITVPQGSLIKIIKKESKDIPNEPLPTYIGVATKQLPNNDQPIRYIHYLKNMKVTDDQDNELTSVLKAILPENALVKADTTTNGVIISTKSEAIRSAIQIIEQLDQAGFQEKMDIIPLRHTDATMVANLISKEILKTETNAINPYRLDAKKSKDVPYFSNFTKIIPETRTNKLIVLGKPQAIDRLTHFIYTYIDTEPETGQSVLHVYKLQYLEASEFAGVLENIVNNSMRQSSGQSAAQGGPAGGPERFFETVVVKADATLAKSGEAPSSGTNKLVIACRNEDWKQIKKLIEELDSPQPQVLIEVLIADLAVTDTRELGAETRMPRKIPLPDGMAFQSAQLAAPPIVTLAGAAVTPPCPPDSTIDSNLLANAFTNSAGEKVSLADLATPGTTVISLNDNDGSTWSLLEILQLFNNSKVISHPHVIATHSQPASVIVGQQRVIPDEVSGATGGTTSVAQKPVDANLVVKLTPLISKGNTVNLSIEVTIDQYDTSPASANNADVIIHRKLTTTANVKSGGIIALGGLTQTTTQRIVSEFPVLGKIPILGWFLKSKNDVIIKNNLTILITPTIIQPRLRGGIGDYTRDYMNNAKEYSGDNLFINVKDPITHWFFRRPTETDEIIDAFAARDEMLLPEYQGTIKGRKKQVITDTKKISSISAAQATSAQQQATEQRDMEQVPDLKSIVENEENPFANA